MRWQELPELHHDTIKLNSKLDVCYPTWADPIEIDNDISGLEIYKCCHKALSSR